ncbi:MAG: hypothetical protein VX822_00860 [Candidatus Neomarinimicrobiota bacterium]|nr:hypothetical protein [Candidatus Neomarinimicrobiota bacterium]
MGQGVQPYILIGETGKDFEGTEEAIIQKFFMNDAEIIGEYRPVGDPDRYMFFVTTKQLKKASRNGGDYGVFLGVLNLAVDVRGDMVYLSVPNIDYWGNLFLQSDFDRVTRAVGEFKTELQRLLPKLRGRFLRPFGSAEPLSVDRLRTYQYMKQMPTRNDMIELGQFENHAEAIKAIEERLKQSSNLTKLFRYDVLRKDATLFGVTIPQEREIAEIVDLGERKATPFYPWKIAVVNGRVFTPSPLFNIPVGFPDMTLGQLWKLRKLSRSIEASLMELD